MYIVLCFISARHCQAPPAKNEGHVVVKSSGLMFGKICMDLNSFENLTDFGCPSARIMKESIQILPDNSTISKYNIVVSTPTPPGFFMSLISFSQPITMSSVTFTGVSAVLISIPLSKYDLLEL